MAAGGEIRKRKQTKKHRSKREGGPATTTTTATTSTDNKNDLNQKMDKQSPLSPQQEQEGEETLWQTFTRHPLIRVGSFILIPYGLYLSYYILLLQHPNYITAMTAGLISPRPAVSITEERQVLIVGTMSSGTVQIASDLHKYFNLEIGHEISDTKWNFVRDGTVSWFHGIRFLPRPSSSSSTSGNEIDNTKLWGSIGKICSNFTDNMGFHPVMYRPPEGKCSYRQKWSNCWKMECYRIVFREWGCALTDEKSAVDMDKKEAEAGGTEKRSQLCEIPFRKTLHQVRNPLRTIESLVAKFCIGGIDGTVHPSFVRFVMALFPNEQQQQQHDFSNDSCIEIAAYFVVLYNNALIEAREKRKGIIDAFYRIEDNTVCDVAQMAGLMSRNTTIYSPNYDRVSSVCKEGVNGVAAEMIERREHKINIDLVMLGWQDLRGGMHGSKRKKGDITLERKVRDLFGKLGYDPSLEDD